MGLYSHFEHNILYTYKNKYTPRYKCLQYAELHSDGIMYYIYSYKPTHEYTHIHTHINTDSSDIHMYIIIWIEYFFLRCKTLEWT